MAEHETPDELSAELADQLPIGSDLQHEFAAQPAYYARWATLHARALDQVRKWEEREEVLFSRLYARYREHNPGAKENDCKAYIRRSQRYSDCRAQLASARHDADMLRGAVKAFEMRRDMLMQLGAMERQEREQTGATGGKAITREPFIKRLNRARAVVKRTQMERQRQDDGDDNEG